MIQTFRTISKVHHQCKIKAQLINFMIILSFSVKLETCDDDDDDDDDVDMVDVTNVGNVSSPPRIDSRTKRHLDCKGLFSSSSAVSECFYSKRSLLESCLDK